MTDQRTTSHRMIRIKQARAPAPGPMPLTLDYGAGTTQTETIVVQPSSSSATENAAIPSMIPKITLVLAVVIACLALALILLIVIFLYRRLHQVKGQHEAPSRSIAFDSNSFVEKRRSLDKERSPTDPSSQIRFGNDEKRSLQSPNTPSTASSQTPTIALNGVPTLRVANEDETDSDVEDCSDPSQRYSADTIAGAYSSQAIRLQEFAEKEKEKKRAIEKTKDGTAPAPSVAGLKLKSKLKGKSRPSWLKPLSTSCPNQTRRAENTGRSPPPAYTAANPSHGYQSPHLVPIPPLLPPQTSRYNMEVPPPTPPASRKSHASSNAGVIPDAAQGPSQLLVVKTDEPLPVVSPARSESFAPKDLMLPPPPPVLSPPWTAKLSPPNSAASDSSIGTPTTPNGTKSPRLMNVVAPFVPTLPDELRVKVGDTVRVLQTYRDGWCFVQFVGKADAPKGVVPIVCLKDRQRFVVQKGKGGVTGMGSLGGSKGSISSLNMGGWR